MKPTKMLIEALLDAAERIESGGCGYDWSCVHTCNCGMLAQSLLKKSGEDIRQTALDMSAIWSDSAEEAQKCHITGIAVPKLMVQLAQFGIELEDYKRIEFCDMKQNWSEMGDPEMGQPYQQADYVTGWFRKLAAELQEQRKIKHEPIPQD